jgi:hypothetical protein
MALNPYQFESSGGYGLGTSTNYGENQYGYDLNNGMSGSSSSSDGSGFDFDLKRPKKPNTKSPQGDPAYEPVSVPNTNPNFNPNLNPLGILGTIGGFIGGVLGGQQQGQGNVSPQGATAESSSGSEQSAPNTSSPDNAGIRPSSNRDLIGDNLKNAYSTPSQFRSPELPTIGYGDAGAAQAAASQAGAGSVTPEQSSQWRMQQAQEANRAAHSTTRDYSSLSSQFKSPELPTIGYDNPQAAGNAAYNSGDWKPAPGRDFSRLAELREQREAEKSDPSKQRSGWDAFANWTSENVGEKLGNVVENVEPANWKYTDPSGNTYTGAAALAMSAMYGAAGAVAGNDLASQMFLLYYDE